MYSVLAGQTWTASSRGACLVTRISATLTIPGRRTATRSGSLGCTPYTSTGTSYSQYSILMKGADACCVRSSNQIEKCN